MNLGSDLATLAATLQRRGQSLDESLRQVRRGFIEQALADCQGNQCEAAKKLGMHRNTISRHIADLGLDPSRFYQAEMRGPGKRPPQSAFEFVRTERRQA